MVLPQHSIPTGEDSRPLVLGIGEVLWDCFPQARRPGGAPANVAYHTRQLGLDGRVLSRIGNDADGAALRAYLAVQGLDVATLQCDPTHATGTVTVHTDHTTGPAYTIHAAVAWDELEWTPEWEHLCAVAQFVCFGTLGQRSLRSRATIMRALEVAAGATRVYDVNLRPPFNAADVVRTSLANADVIKLNDAEVTPVAALFGRENASPAELAAALLAQPRCRYVCVTHGAAGCTVYTRAGAVAVPGLRVRVADTVGSGDAFTAGFIYGLWRRWSTDATGRFANLMGALVAKHAGAMPSVSAALGRLVQRIEREAVR